VKAQPLVKVTIVNVVATASLNQPMDFEELRRYGEIFHDSDVYSGRVAYFKTKQMQGRVSIFSSGKMISVGTKNETQAQKELQLAKQFLVEKGLIKEVTLEPKTQNIVATVDFEQPLNLEELSQKTRAIYEPEQFPRSYATTERAVQDEYSGLRFRKNSNYGAHKLRANRTGNPTARQIIIRQLKCENFMSSFFASGFMIIFL
jgi:TATA-box binding protein (TBP) (component of TFIID and TFIIIB)